MEDEQHFLEALHVPPTFELHVQDLSIGIPKFSAVLPLPIPIPIPASLYKRFSGASASQDSNILRNVSAKCKPGEMLAIIGGSGSGKSTLLNAIVGRLSNLPITSGQLAFVGANGAKSTPQEMKAKIGFVPQHDFLLPHLTVQETIYYAAALRLPSSIDKRTKCIIVDQVIQELGLKDVAHTIIGGSGTLRKGISGGERRRVSIGCILVSLPSILILDEPTTGLDSYTAYQLLLTLSSISKNSNRTIIVSIHQPRSDAFTIFDRLLVLTKGKVAYSGLTGRSLSWFAGLGLSLPDGVNPLDFLIDVSNVRILEEGGREAGDNARVEMILKAWKIDGQKEESEEHQTAETTTPTREGLDLSPKTLFNTDGKHRPGLISQTVTLTSRANKNAMRNYDQMIGLTCQAVGIGVLLGVSFYRLDESPAGIQSLKTLCFQHITYFYLTLIYNVYRYCESELIIFDRERADHLYKAGPWLISEIISSLSINVTSTSIFAIVIYFLSNLRIGGVGETVGYLFILISECILVQLCTIAIALFAASIIRIYATAYLVANGISIFFLLTAGYVLIYPPVYVNWIRFISVYYYGFRLMTISQFRNRTFRCEGVEGVLRNQCEGNQVLAGLRIPKDEPLGPYYAGFVGMFVVFNVLSAVILATHHVGGVKHAAKIGSSRSDRKRSTAASDLDVIRQRVDVSVDSIGLSWVPSRVWPMKMGRHEEKTILNDVSFNCPAGQITAILGPSGAGKSSLLQLIAARSLNAGAMAHFQSRGLIKFNGRPRNANTRSLIGYIEQEDDYHLPALTVRETLRYAAILRLPQEMSRKRKLARAEEVSRMLGLDGCADNLVGGPLVKGISGGEKRRLSLAVQMMNDPPVLIVDEVTSGLDAATAANVMSVLQAIAQSGRTVMFTLHQPRSDIYHTLDNIVVLVKGGCTAYAGPRLELEPTLLSQGYLIPVNYNPADFILDTISTNKGAGEGTESRVNSMVQFWSNHEKNLGHVPIPQVELNLDSLRGNADTHSHLTSLSVAGPVVLERMIRNLWRQQPIFWVRLQQTPFLGVILLLFYQRLSSGPTGGQDRIGLIVQSVSSIPFVGLLNCIAIFPADRNLFLHEYKSSAAYSTLTFLLAFTLVELPWQILSSILFAVIVNIGTGMQTSPKIFFEFAAVIWAMQSTGESAGILFASVTNSTGLSVSFVSTFLTVLTQFSGIISLSVPDWISNIAWATSMKSGSRIMVINEAIGLELDCSQASILSGQCLVQNGRQLLALFGWDDLVDTEELLGLLIACCIGYRLLSALALMWKVRG